MADYTVASRISYSPYGEEEGTGIFPEGDTYSAESIDDGSWDEGDTSSDSGSHTYTGYYEANGHLFLIFEGTGNWSNQIISTTASVYDPGYPASFLDIPALNTEPLPVCFAAGSLISTPRGEMTVETLTIGDTILTADRRAVPVKWIGRQTLHKFFTGERYSPICVKAGALGNGLPHGNQTLTADHALMLDGLAINAGALVNGETIIFVPMSELPEQSTYYHIETEDHDTIVPMDQRPTMH